MAESTPMLDQYRSIKEKHPNELLFFRLGDFYELFGPDAQIASRILDIVLTARHKGTSHETPMCGVPHHALDSYLAKLIKAGQRVAICDQVSDPSLPGLVRREVIRVVTPGTNLEASEQKTNRFILSLVWQKNIWGLSAADLSTGEFKTGEFADFNLLKSEIFRLNPSEVIVARELANDLRFKEWLKALNHVAIFSLSAFETAYGVLQKHFQVKNLESFGVERLAVGIEAAGRLLAYLKETQKANLKHITKIQRQGLADYLILDEVTIRNLEIFQSLNGRDNQSSLISVIDKTLTNHGGRLLRQWLALPLKDVLAIQERLAAVEELRLDHISQRKLAEKLKDLADLPRLVGRLGCQRGTARDMVALKNSLRMAPEIQSLLSVKQSALLQRLRQGLPDLSVLISLLDEVFLEEPAGLITEGNMIKSGYNAQLDELRAFSHNAKTWLANFQAQEIERTKISSLKVRYNKIFGYYIEISKANLSQAPLNYTRKQTLVNAERFITPELKEYEEKIFGAEERMHTLEQQIFLETLEKVEKYFSQINLVADILAQVDVLRGFAQLAEENRYNQPQINASGQIKIKNGRHPVIERFQKEGYVPNDLLLDHEKNEFILLTGPNMSGKSSFLRQTALIVLLAQIGCFVPAEAAEIGVVDRIFTRVGASDNLAQGVSTFMMEMQEAANILNNATKDSLIILDELGRGTSTYDGVSIAWAIMEYIHDRLGAKTLFATHYHELTKIAEKLDRAENYCVAVSEEAGRVVFLHKIIRGATSQSYGIEVARLAGLPEALTNQASLILKNLENRQDIKVQLDSPPPQGRLPLQLSSNEKKVVGALADLKVEEITPLEAIQKLAELKNNLDKCG